MLTVICSLVLWAIFEAFVNNRWKPLAILTAIYVITYISSQIFY